MIVFTIIGVAVATFLGIAVGTWAVLEISERTDMDISDSILALFGVVILVLATIWSILN